MARYYNVRDLIGHWVAPRSAEGKMCPHACCRGKRVHPENMPVVLPSRLLRRASENDLLAHYERLRHSHTVRADRGRLQVLAEIDRRELVGRASAARQAERDRQRDARYAQRAAQVMEREAIIENAWLQAEAATSGVMLNKRGRALGISDRSLFRGPEARARKYASEELTEYWRTHPRPTGAMFQGRDTRVAERFEDTVPARFQRYLDRPVGRRR